MPLKLILMSPDGTVGADGKARHDILHDLCLFIGRMASRGVQVVVWSRRRMTIDGEPLDTYLARNAKTAVRYIQAGAGQFPIRRRGGSIDPILSITNAARHETILVGSKEEDMLAGVNNRLLLVRPAWYGDNIDYGFRVPSIDRLTRFCEIFALRKHPIYWSVESGTLQVRSMGPYSTYFQELAEYSAGARQVAKSGRGDPRFWFLAVVSALYSPGSSTT